MSDTSQVTETDAIRQVIADTGALDYIDVVNEVRKRFRIEVTSAQVEQVYHDLDTETKPAPKSRTTVTMTSTTADEAAAKSEPEITLPTRDVPSEPDLPKDDLTLALNFVKSVGGLAKAKRALMELESVMLGGS